MVKYTYGWKKQSLDHRDLQYDAHPVDIRNAVDLRPQMPAVYDQGQIGSCVANATAGAFHYSRIAQSLPNWTPSRLFIYWNARNYEGTADQDSGCECRDGVKSVAQIGVCSELDWAYNVNQFATKPPATAYADAIHAKATQYYAVPQKLEHILSCLNHKLPVIFGSSVFQSFEGQYVASTGNVSMPGPTDAPIGGHAQLIVGWKPENQTFIVRNSWGAGWGDHGYSYFPRDYILSPSLSSDFWSIFLTSRN